MIAMAMVYATQKATAIVMMGMLHLYVLRKAMEGVLIVDRQVIQAELQHCLPSYMCALS